MPYTYIITHIPSNVKYYGVRYAKNCHPDDLGKTYFSSSKAINKLIKEEGIENFKFDVRKKFDTKQEALNWETKFLSRINAAESSNWFNLSNTTNTFYNRGNYKLSEVTRQKMSKPKSENHKRKLKEHLDAKRIIPEWTDERKKKQSERMKGNLINKGREGWNKGMKYTNEKLKGNTNSSGKHNLKEVVCPHCGRQGRGPNMTRYHFDKCNSITL